MRSKPLTALLLVSVFFVSAAYAQNPDPPAQIDLNALRRHATSYDERQVGKRVVVTDIALPSNIEMAEVMEMLKQPKNQEEVLVFTSIELGERLRPHMTGTQKRMRVTFTFVEARKKSKISLAPYATKIEGLDADGSVAWTETGPQPSQTKFDLNIPHTGALAMKFVATKVDRSQ
ncbi:MAG TPA: hypothetical protein VGW36_06890 [Pyrinomonadaceae bacterium]|nr:hypothetical protein [Pyrinomonadaceae bacterium]